MSDWEPKQGELVFYKDANGNTKRILFVSKYNDDYIIHKDGNVFAVDSIEQINSETPQITVGSVWEWDKKLWVAVHISKDNLKFSFWCPDSSEYYPHAPIKNFKPIPDKIGMAPALYQYNNGNFVVSNDVFDSHEKAAAYYEVGRKIKRLVSWPSSNASWVIVPRSKL